MLGSSGSQNFSSTVAALLPGLRGGVLVGILIRRGAPTGVLVGSLRSMPYVYSGERSRIELVQDHARQSPITGAEKWMIIVLSVLVGSLFNAVP